MSKSNIASVPTEGKKLEAEEAKRKILENLGANNKTEMVEIINGHLTNDAYRENSLNIFKRTILHQNGKPKFSDACKDFAKLKLDKNFSRRYKIAAATSVGYAAATAFAFTGVGIPAAIATSAAVTALSGVAEAREKRNIAAIGHCQEHLAGFSLQSIVNIAKKPHGLTKEALDNINSISNLSLEEPKVAEGGALVRWGSYVSGAIISITQRIVDFVAPAVQFVSSVVGGIIAPILPLTNAAVSRIATNRRQQAVEKNFADFEKITEILFNPQSYKDPSRVDFNELRKNFCKELSKPHCKEGSKYWSGDKSTNARKVVATLNWMGNRFRRLLPNSERFGTEDLTLEPSGFDDRIYKLDEEAAAKKAAIDQKLEAIKFNSKQQNYNQVEINLNSKTPSSSASSPSISPDIMRYLANQLLAGAKATALVAMIAEQNLTMGQLKTFSEKFKEELITENNKIAQNDVESEDFLRPKKYCGIGIKSKYPPEFQDGFWVFEINEVARNGPAANAGIKAGDKIKFAGKEGADGLKDAVISIRNNGLDGAQIIRSGQEIKTNKVTVAAISNTEDKKFELNRYGVPEIEKKQKNQQSARG